MSQILETIVQNTNIKGELWPVSRGPFARAWKTLDVPELLGWLAILFYIGLYIENETKDYWRRSGASALRHDQVHQTIEENQWHDI
jgi:hypothetical protein